MFCKQCETKIEDDDIKFCPMCGAKVDRANDSIDDSAEKSIIPVTDVEDQGVTHKQNKIPRIILSFLAVLVIVGLGYVVYNFLGESYIDVADDYVDAIIDGDTDDLLELMHKKSIQYIIDNSYNNDKNAFLSDLKGVLKNNKILLKNQYGNDLEHELTVSDINLEQEHINQIKQYFKENLDLKISDIKYLELDIDIDTGFGSYDSVRKSLTVVKIGNSWYVANLDDISFNTFDILF